MGWGGYEILSRNFDNPHGIIVPFPPDLHIRNTVIKLFLKKLSLKSLTFFGQLTHVNAREKGLISIIYVIIIGKGTNRKTKQMKETQGKKLTWNNTEKYGNRIMYLP